MFQLKLKSAMFPECFRITLILAVEVIVYSRYTFFLEKFNSFKTHKNIIFRNIFTFWVHFVMATTYSLGISSKDMSNWKILYFLEVITQLSTPSTVRFFYLLGLKKKSFFRLTWLPSFSSQYTKNWKWHHKKNHGRKDLCFHRFPMNIVSKTASRIVQVSIRLIFKIASNLHFYITPKTKKNSNILGKALWPKIYFWK